MVLQTLAHSHAQRRTALLKPLSCYLARRLTHARVGALQPDRMTLAGIDVQGSDLAAKGPREPPIACPMSTSCRDSSLVERLARVIHPAYIPAWLSKPNPALDGDKRRRWKPGATRATSMNTSIRHAEVILRVAKVELPAVCGPLHQPLRHTFRKSGRQVVEGLDVRDLAWHGRFRGRSERREPIGRFTPSVLVVSWASVAKAANCECPLLGLPAGARGR
jgi:hypothetical protein